MDDRGSDEFEPVVVEPSKRFFLAAGLSAVLAVGAGSYWLLTGFGVPATVRPEALIAIGLGIAVMMVPQWGRRIGLKYDTPSHRDTAEAVRIFSVPRCLGVLYDSKS